jgi:hypothetical protein
MKTFDTGSADRALTTEQYKVLRKDLTARKNALKNVPRFRLKFFGEKALLLTTPKQRQVRLKLFRFLRDS